eukprot:m.73446 g.73446  ORF g.73446 m.73446 type:complete len:359 (+) comp14350_c0_seq2:288-1364(+)
MSCFMSQEQKAARRRNKMIEQHIKQERKTLRKEIKLLLLGAGESGKSTVVKQMRVIHGSGYNQEERLAFKELVFWNVVQSVHVILEAAEDWGIKLSPTASSAADTLWNYERQMSTLFSSEFLPAIVDVLRDPGVDKVLARRNEIQLNDSAEYYFESLNRFGSSNYLPDDQDILRSRVATTGINEFKFEMDKGNTLFRMIDVGGQRSERRKWVHCFEDVTAITFIVACSGYNQKCVEDGKMNRMVESLALFDHIVNYEVFVHASMILFLNKVDLLEQKIQTFDLASYFPDFPGPARDAEAAQVFIRDMFIDAVRPDESGKTRTVYPFFTTATNTKNMEHVILSVKDTILQNNLRAYAVV